MAKILPVYNRLQAGDYENGNGGKRRVSQLTDVLSTQRFNYSLLNGWQAHFITSSQLMHTYIELLK